MASLAKMGMSLPSTSHVHETIRVSFGVAERTSCSVTVTFYANAQGLKSCDPSPQLRLWILPLKQREKARRRAKANGLSQKTQHGPNGRKLSGSNLRSRVDHAIGLEAK